MATIIEEQTCTPPEILEIAESECQDLLPQKSKHLYNKKYQEFIKWSTENKIYTYSENVLIAYFKYLRESKKMAPNTLWVIYSMLKTTLMAKHNINIVNFHKLKTILKNKNKGYEPKKAKILSANEINLFVEQAPDTNYLFHKVILIIGICGGCRRIELKNLTIENVIDLKTEFLIKILPSKNDTSRSFLVTGPFYSYVKKYIDLRPPNINSFFLNFQNGKCYKQVVGINKIGNVAQQVATYLKLPNPSLYTGHCFRRSGATILADSGGDTLTLKNFGGWKSTTVMEGYVENSLKKKKEISKSITNEITNNQSMSTNEETQIINTNLNFEIPSTSSQNLPVAMFQNCQLHGCNIYVNKIINKK